MQNCVLSTSVEHRQSLAHVCNGNAATVVRLNLAAILNQWLKLISSLHSNLSGGSEIMACCRVKSVCGCKAALTNWADSG